MKAIGINNIANAINDGFARWAGSLDRSGIVNQYGNGDILGGRISEKRRQADLWGGLAQGGLGLLGSLFGVTPWGLASGGPLVWGSIGTAGGKAIDTGLHLGPNKEATEAAYAGLWQNRSVDAMELAANLGSPNEIREAFKTAADAAAAFGYSAEEGMDAMKQAAQQGLGGTEAKEAARQVFDYERRTGADRGTLMGISTMSARYGMGDALGEGWAGLQASVMKPGQYNEYLRAMQRVMEDGISKGFSKSAKEIAGDLTFLKQLSGGSELWKGEQGQKRLSQMSAGLEAATGLASSSDILAFRGAKNVLGNDTDGRIWNQIANLDGKEGADIKRSGSYIDAMILMERGLNADTFSEIMRLNRNAEGGDRSAVIERMRDQFGLNYTNSAMLYDQWAMKTDYGTKEMSSEESKSLIDTYGKMPPPANSPELEIARITEEIKNIYTQSGMIHWDESITEIKDELVNAIQELKDKSESKAPYQPKDTVGLTPSEALKIRQQEYNDALASGNTARIEEAARALELANMEALAPKYEDPIDQETRRMGEIDRMLIKSGMAWDKERSTFFTGDGNALTKNDDEKAYDRLSGYEQFPEAHQSLAEVFDIMRSFSQDQIKRANESNIVNSAIPQDIMTDRTGQELLEAIRNMKITLDEEQN
jgi:hypothetical protein